MTRLACATVLCVAAAWSAPTARASWMPNGVPLCIESHTQSQPTIVVDSAGGAIVVCTDQRLGPADIYAQRVDSSGTVLWSTNGVAVCAYGIAIARSPVNEHDPRAIPGGLT